MWRCLECQSRPALCRDCMRTSHSLHPLHRIQFWTGTHYCNDWLHNLGVTINLGHRGKCCLRQSSKLNSGPYKPPASEIHALKDYFDPYQSPSQICDTPEAAKLVNVLHTNGVHKVWIRHCICIEGKETEHLLEQALFPSTFKAPRTAFTFILLNDFRKANLECKTTAYSYFHKLQRVNSEFFPTSCPVSIRY